jgi:hypothetical protein
VAPPAVAADAVVAVVAVVEQLLLPERPRLLLPEAQRHLPPAPVVAAVSNPDSNSRLR